VGGLLEAANRCSFGVFVLFVFISNSRRPTVGTFPQPRELKTPPRTRRSLKNVFDKAGQGHVAVRWNTMHVCWCENAHVYVELSTKSKMS
jgi:hypothetical protein